MTDKHERRIVLGFVLWHAAVALACFTIAIIDLHKHPDWHGNPLFAYAVIYAIAAVVFWGMRKL
jgi:hypothetical protein